MLPPRQCILCLCIAVLAQDILRVHGQWHGLILTSWTQPMACIAHRAGIAHHTACCCSWLSAACGLFTHCNSDAVLYVELSILPHFGFTLIC